MSVTKDMKAKLNFLKKKTINQKTIFKISIKWDGIPLRAFKENSKFHTDDTGLWAIVYIKVI